MNGWTSERKGRQMADAVSIQVEIDAALLARIRELEAEVGRLTNELAQMTAQRDIAREHNAAVVSELATRDEQAPRLDWSKAPDWAQWWATDANGESYYYEVEPGLRATTWAVASTERFMSAGKVEFGGRNWRTLVQRRPRAGD